MPNKVHPADAADRAKIATATHFNVHLRRSPTSKINREAATLADAAKIADEITAEFKKVPMVYAITPDKMAGFVPKEMVEAARNPHAASNALIANDPELAATVKVEAEEAPDFVPAFLKNNKRKAALEIVKASDGAAPAKGGDDYPAPAAKPKPTKKAEAPKAGKPAAAFEAAQRGEISAAPDFSAEMHNAFV